MEFLLQLNWKVYGNAGFRTLDWWDTHKNQGDGSEVILMCPENLNMNEPELRDSGGARGRSSNFTL
jgi:hypothetical protein